MKVCISIEIKTNNQQMNSLISQSTLLDEETINNLIKYLQEI